MNYLFNRTFLVIEKEGVFLIPKKCSLTGILHYNFTLLLSGTHLKNKNEMTATTNNKNLLFMY